MKGKCKLCGQPVNNKRGAHCHLMIKHGAEYEKAGRRQDKFISWETDLEAADKNGSKKDPKSGAEALKNKPRGIRHLNLNDQNEECAHFQVDPEYNERFEYIDDDGYVYTAGELKKRGWL